MTSRFAHTLRSTLLGFATCLGALACTAVSPNGTGVGGSAGSTVSASGAPSNSGVSGGSAAGMNGAGGSAMGGMGAAGAPSPVAGSSGNPATAGTGPGTAGTGMGGAASAGTNAGGASMGGTTNAGANAGGADTAGASTGGGGAGTGGAGTGGAGPGGAGPGGDFILTAPWDSPDTCTADASDTCGNIPPEHRLEMIGGDNVMPLLSWPEGPEGTLSYALVYHDHSFEQGGGPFVHWALWNLPAGTTSVDASTIPAGVDQSSFQGDGWTGSGACGNVYELVLYALSVEEYLPGGDQTAVRDGLEGDDVDLVLARDSIFGQTQDPCN